MIARLVRLAILIDISIMNDGNLVKKTSKINILSWLMRLSIHVDLTIIVPVVVSVNGLIAKSLNRHLKLDVG